LALVIIVAIVLLGRKRDSDRLDRFGKFTIATTTKYSIAASGDKYVSYEFKFHHELIHWSSRNYHDFDLNRRYFVRFDSTNARNSELLSTPLVPDTLLNIPPGGWASLPVPH
jgi:hypothetical protein